MTDDTTVTWQDGVPVVRLEPWTGPIAPDDPDANFKREVASTSLQDPLVTLTTLGRNVSVPVGAVVRSILVRWAGGGAEALLELGPSTVERMLAVVEEAESADDDAARLAAFDTLAQMLRWVAHGLTDPETTYPQGGASG